MSFKKSITFLPANNELHRSNIDWSTNPQGKQNLSQKHKNICALGSLREWNRKKSSKRDRLAMVSFRCIRSHFQLGLRAKLQTFWLVLGLEKTLRVSWISLYLFRCVSVDAGLCAYWASVHVGLFLSCSFQIDVCEPNRGALSFGRHVTISEQPPFRRWSHAE